MLELRYLHFNNDEVNRKSSKKQARDNCSRTLAIEPLTAKQIKEILAVFIANGDSQYSIYTRLIIGIAKKSLDDSYSRKTGRELSASKAKNVNLDIASVTVTKEHILINFYEYEGVKLTARLNRLTGFSTFFGKMNG